jgi:hypothetical protein
MKSYSEWFTFESRCLLCGKQMQDGHGAQKLHVEHHVREGYLSEDYEQLKPHPVGFPGPPLGQQPPARQIRCSPPTTPA